MVGVNLIIFFLLLNPMLKYKIIFDPNTIDAIEFYNHSVIPYLRLKSKLILLNRAHDLLKL